VTKGAGLKVVLMAISANFLITIAKGLGWLFSGSPSMLAEAIHSAADTLNQVLILIGIHQSEKQANQFFPWGHGQARYVWNLMSAMGIFFIGFGFTTYHGFSALLHPHHTKDESTFLMTIGILVLSLLIEGYVFLVALKETKKTQGKVSFISFVKTSDDPATIGVLFEDGVAVLGVLIALTCVLSSHYLGAIWADALGSIVIGFLMGALALILAFLNGKLLLNTSTPMNQTKIYKGFVESLPLVDKVHKITPVVLGAGKVHLSIELELDEQILIGPGVIKKSIDDLNSGKEPASVISQAAGRMVRLVGHELMKIEKSITNEYSEIVTVELEIK